MTYSLTLGVCLCLRVSACVHFYVGVYCLSPRYLTLCVSSHVHRFAEHIRYAISFVCVHSSASVCYLCVADWLGPLCVISDLNFMAGWVWSGAAAGFRIIQNYVVILNHKAVTWVQHTASYWGFSHKHKVATAQATLHLRSLAQWKGKISGSLKLTQNTMMRYLRAVKMFTLENEAVRAETECSRERPWLGH